MSEDEYDGPESDPYCAHWLSVFEQGHGVKCETCGHSCKEHLILLDDYCSECGSHCEFKNEAWPKGELEPVK